MLINALCFLTGISFVQTWSQIPDQKTIFVLGAVFLAVVVIWWCYRLRPYSWIFRVICFILAGLLWATLHGKMYLDHRLPESLAGKDILVEGVIEGIPVTRDQVQRFILKVYKFGDNDIPVPPEKLRLSWYYGKPVNAGEHWRFVVRLKPPHGFFNPGGFDYESWLYQHRIHATGYIRKSPDNSRLTVASVFSVDAYRQQLSSYIQSTLDNQPLTGLVTALAVGDRSPITSDHWDALINTGTNHLMAISGLHIGLVAIFAFWLIRRLTPAQWMNRIPSQQLGISVGLIFALVYALMAGFSIPTQRALIMLLCVAGAWLLKRNFRMLNALSTALLAVLIWDPVAVLSPGFWFSFLAVFIIYYVFSGRIRRNKGVQQWGWMQIAIALGLFPVSLLLFQQTSLAGPIANLVMVPYVSFLVVPLVLLALICLPISTTIADFLLLAANELLEVIWPVISYLSSLPLSHWSHAAPGSIEVMLAMLGVFILLSPKGVPARWLSVIFIMPVLMSSQPELEQNSYELTLLDVGQGLSAVIRTRKHVLVFDTGNKLGDRLDAGKAVIEPFLRKKSVDKIDRLIISHGDADHIGGAESLLTRMNVGSLIGQDIENLPHADKKTCTAGEKWYWDGISFEFLHPDENTYKRSNNRSCVLKVSGPGGNLLITGDIEKKVEKRLLTLQTHTHQDILAADVLVVPHHGSKTSSSRLFIEAVNPEIVLFPAGYRNRYRLPNRDIVSRYAQNGAVGYSSGYSGAIQILFDPGKGISKIEQYRSQNAKYWNHLIELPGDDPFGHSLKSSKIWQKTRPV